MSFFKKYVISNVDDLPISVYKRLILTGQLSILAGVVSLIYLFVEGIYGEASYVAYYGIVTVGSVVSLLLLRLNKRNAAKFTLLFSALIVVALFSSIEPYRTGVYMIYIVVSIGAFTLFGYEDIKWSFVLVTLTIGTFIFNYYISDFNFLGFVEYNEQYFQYSFVVNFFVAILSTGLMFYYTLVINYTSERELKEGQVALLELTEKLKLSKARFDLAIKGSSAGIWDWNFVDSRIYFSPMLQTLLGYEEGELDFIKYKDFLSIIHPSDVEKLRDALKEHVHNNTPFWVEARFKKKDGSYVWVLDTGQAEWNEKGDFVRMAGAVINIADRKKAEKQLNDQNLKLQRTNEELDRFVYSASHDLKAPLCSILGIVNLAEMSEPKGDQLYFLELIKNRVEKLNGFIEDIIDYSRNSRLEVTKSVVDLNGMIESIISDLEYFEQRDKITIYKDFDPELELVVDKGRLETVLKNLLVNAVKYHNLTQDDPYIRISVAQHGSDAEIFVEDNGTGILEEHKANIFDMFYRATDNAEGSGLGLYIAREMVDKMGGEIEVISEFNNGSRFSVMIPNCFEMVLAV
ncbi:MAG: PAS domain-containing sensor histidine kinase [Fulvivirga sp.]